jgi:hypothetical protein
MKNFIKNSLFLAIAISIIAGISYAALGDRLIDLIPGNTADKGGLTHSLNDIYDKLTGETSLAPMDSSYPNGDTSVIVQSFRTVEEVWDAVPDELTFLTSGLTVSLTPGILHTATSVEVSLPVGAFVPPEEWSTVYSSAICWSSSRECSGATSDGYGAIEYCAHLEDNGITLNSTPQNLWRLPTIKEFTTIADYTKYNQATQVSGFSAGANYWSSSDLVNNTDYAWNWSSTDGFLGYMNKKSKYRVRCVR